MLTCNFQKLKTCWIKNSHLYIKELLLYDKISLKPNAIWNSNILEFRSNFRLKFRSNFRLKFRSNFRLTFRSNFRIKFRSNIRLKFRSNFR